MEDGTLDDSIIAAYTYYIHQHSNYSDKVVIANSVMIPLLREVKDKENLKQI